MLLACVLVLLCSLELGAVKVGAWQGFMLCACIRVKYQLYAQCSLEDSLCHLAYLFLVDNARMLACVNYQHEAK